jgi:hypothetical protein
MKILIVGSGPEWDKAPFSDESYHIWTYGLIAHLLPRVNVVFEMHRRDLWRNFQWETTEAEYVARLNGFNVPVMMCEEQSDIPKSQKYPLKEISELVGPYFASTISYQLALACLIQQKHGGVNEISLYGFDLKHWEEWAYQRPNVNRLIGFAQGLGIPVKVASQSLIGIPWLYGYEVDREQVRVSTALLEEDYAQLAALMNRIGEHQLAMAYAKDKAKEEKRGTLPPDHVPDLRSAAE